MTLQDRLTTLFHAHGHVGKNPESSEAATQIEQDLLAIVGEDEDTRDPADNRKNITRPIWRNQLRAELRTQIIKYCRGE